MNLPPGSSQAPLDGHCWAWKIADEIDRWGDYSPGEYVIFWDNHHFEDSSLHTPDNLINKVGVIEYRSTYDNQFIVHLLGEADTTNNDYRISVAGDRVRIHAEYFKRVYRNLTPVNDITFNTHAFGAFMQCVVSLVSPM